MFNKRVKIKELLNTEPTGQEVTIMGWVRTFRNNQFIALNDGSTNNNLQVLAELGKFDEAMSTLNRAEPAKLQGVWRDNILKSIAEVQKARGQ